MLVGPPGVISPCHSRLGSRALALPRTKRSSPFQDRVLYRVPSFLALFRPLLPFTDEWPYRLRRCHVTGKDRKGRETPTRTDKREVGSSTLPRPMNFN